MTTDSSNVRLGDLLTGAGLLKPGDLREAMLVAKQQGLPVGRVLIMSAYLTEHQLQAAVHAQSLLKDGLIDLETVMKALASVSHEDITLDEALERLKWQKESGILTNKLGELMLESGIITKNQLQSALTQCQTIGLPLGRVLVVTSVISEQLLAAALNAQVLLRDKKITREQAVQGLTAARDRQVPIEQVFTESGTLQLPTTPTIRLGELMVQAGYLDDPSVMGAVELGLLNDRPIGQVLRQLGLIGDDVLNAAVSLQKKVAEGAVSMTEAPRILATAVSKQITIDEAINEMQPAQAAPLVVQQQETLPLYQFVQVAGLVLPKQVELAIKTGSKDSDIMGQMLILAGVLEPYLVHAAQQCNSLIAQGILNTEQAIFALKQTQTNQVPLEQTFESLNWDINPQYAEALTKARDETSHLSTTSTQAAPGQPLSISPTQTHPAPVTESVPWGARTGSPSFSAASSSGQVLDYNATTSAAAVPQPPTTTGFTQVKNDPQSDKAPVGDGVHTQTLAGTPAQPPRTAGDQPALPAAKSTDVNLSQAHAAAQETRSADTGFQPFLTPAQTSAQQPSSPSDFEWPQPKQPVSPQLPAQPTGWTPLKQPVSSQPPTQPTGWPPPEQPVSSQPPTQPTGWPPPERPVSSQPPAQSTFQWLPPEQPGAQAWVPPAVNDGRTHQSSNPPFASRPDQEQTIPSGQTWKREQTPADSSPHKDDGKLGVLEATHESVTDAVEELSEKTDDSGEPEKPKKRLMDFMPKFGQQK